MQCRRPKMYYKTCVTSTVLQDLPQCNDFEMGASCIPRESFDKSDNMFYCHRLQRNRELASIKWVEDRDHDKQQTLKMYRTVLVTKKNPQEKRQYC